LSSDSAEEDEGLSIFLLGSPLRLTVEEGNGSEFEDELQTFTGGESSVGARALAFFSGDLHLFPRLVTHLLFLDRIGSCALKSSFCLSVRTLTTALMS
jgi:hypothetical protein